MSKKIIIDILNNEKEFIYKFSKVMANENWEILFNKIIRKAHRNSFELEKNTDKKELIEEISIISSIELLGIEKIKEILDNLSINYEEDEIEECLKNNIKLIIESKEIEEPLDLEGKIDMTLKNKMKKMSIILGSILIFMTSIIFILMPHYAYKFTPIGAIFNNIHNKIFEPEANKYGMNIHTSIQDIKLEKDTIDLIHHMSNYLIFAANNNAKIGIVEVTPDNIEMAITEVKENMKDKKLERMLEKWREGDFGNATIVHNYVWRKLNGQIGYAISIDENAVDSVLEKYYDR